MDLTYLGGSIQRLDLLWRKHGLQVDALLLETGQEVTDVCLHACECQSNLIKVHCLVKTFQKASFQHVRALARLQIQSHTTKQR